MSVGSEGEKAARDFLITRGLQILASNVRFGRKSGIVGELDLVVRDGFGPDATIAFVEVKTRQARRAGVVAPAESVHEDKQRQIARLALAWVARDGVDAGFTEEMSLRFDVVTVVLDPSTGAIVEIEHLPGAFLAPDNFDA